MANSGNPTIGIVAGMGPRSTGPFVEQLYDACRRIYGAHADADFPQILVCSQPAPFNEHGPQDHDGLRAATMEGIACLSSGGASFAAIACNTVHAYFDEFLQRAQIPLLSIVDIVCETLPTRARVALVAAAATSEAGIYQRRLLATGHAPVEHEQIQQRADALLQSVRAGEGAPALAAHWRSINSACREAGADCILVACLDLSASLKDVPEEQLVTVDAAQTLANRCVHEWLRLGGKPWVK
jgi:aspartate racemase